MSVALALLGRIYTTLSFAALPTAIAVLAIVVAGFKENGPQSQGLGALLVIAAGAIAGLGVNACAAGLLAWLVRPARPRFAHVAVLAGAATLVLGAFFIAA